MSERANVKSPFIPTEAGNSSNSNGGAAKGEGKKGKNAKSKIAASSSAAESDEVSVTIPDRALGVASHEYDGDEVEAEEKKDDKVAASSIPAASPRSSAPKTASAVVSAEEIDSREEFLKINHMVGYEFSAWRELRYWIGCVCSAFILFLLNLWFPDRFTSWRYRTVPLGEAEYVHVFGQVHGAELVPVQELGHDVTLTMMAEEEAEDQLNQHPSMQRRNSVDLLHAGHRGRMFIFRHMRYIYSPIAQTFILQQADAVSKRVEAQTADQRHTSVAGLKSKELAERVRIGLTTEQWLDNLVLYGQNALLLEVPSIPRLLFTEVFHPFYVFQMYSVVLWGFESYWIFAGAIAVIAVVSIVQTLVETRRRMTELAALARFDCPVSVLRNSKFTIISSTKLVPGDIVRVATGLLPCDLALLEGGAVVNESMLTGESVPVVKVNVQWPANRLSDTLVPLGLDSRQTLFSATKILQLKPLASGGDVLAMVVRTGFATTKGSLILSILYPQPSEFKFVAQSYKFVAALFSLAMVGFAISVWQLKVVQDAELKTIIVRALDLITIVVPPSLPLALTVGTNFALMWLRDEKIFCISPARINMAGKVKLMAFDKTGTLTAESLEFMGVFAAALESDRGAPSNASAVASSSASNRIVFGKFQSPHSKLTPMVMVAGELNDSDVPETPQTESDADAESSSNGDQRSIPDTTHSVRLSPELKVSMACCQSLAVHDGELIGDPLEQQTFEAAGATLQDTGDLQGFQQIIRVQLSPEQTISMGVREQFEFSSALQRMSVLCKDLETGTNWAFVKGSPEMMETLCLPATIPADYKSVLAYFAHQGYRVIAIGRKIMPADIPLMDKPDLRILVEQQLQFLGLVLLENKVKPESEPTLQILRNAAIRCCMITGDNPLTAVTVAKECKLVAPGTRVFQSMLVADASNSTGQRIEWHDTDDETLKLDPLTLRLAPHVQQELMKLNHGKPIKYELAVTGPVFKMLQDAEGSHLPQSYFHRVLLNGQIFARMSPDQKATVIAELQGMGIYCGMCGDGANDCASLKTAHVGVSLSESEASIAAPFTYQRPNISCIPILLSEGRSSLVTSFQLFRYMAMYSMIQFGAVILTYFQGSVLGNWQYLYEDLWLVFPLTIFMGATRANRNLSVKRPSGNLLSIANVSNLIIHIFICVSIQVAVYETIRKEEDYVHLDNPENGPESYITTSLYYFSNFQYSVMAVLFSLGRPWKAAIITNYKFSACVVLGWLANCALLFSPLREPGFFRSDDLALPWYWRRSIAGYVLLFTGLAVLWELVVFPILVQMFKKLSRSGLQRGSVFGRPKALNGPNAKLYHKMRGEFEANWASSGAKV